MATKTWLDKVYYQCDILEILLTPLSPFLSEKLKHVTVQILR